MFCGLSRRDLAPARWKIAFPLFGLLYGVLLCLISLLGYGLRSQLAGAELQAAEQRLEGYLADNTDSRFRLPSVDQDDALRSPSLAFIRVVRGNDHLLLTREDLSSPHLQELLHSDPRATVVWLRLQDDTFQAIWTVVSRELENGTIIQAGVQSNDSYQLYLRIVRLCLLVAGGALPLVWWVALLCARRTVLPLNRLGAELEALAAGRQQLLPENVYGDEVDGLYHRVNGLIKQNRHLIAEMQASLDNVAHDLRTPMTRLRSVAEYGLQAQDDPERLREALSDCLEESERLLAMLKIMMSVVEAESGTMRLDSEEFDLHQSVADMIALYDYVAQEHRVTIEAPGSGEVCIAGDRTRLSQVWANLLDNGIKYNQDGGWLRVEIDRQPGAGMVEIRFCDNGMGISAGEQGRIWERLYRGDRSRSRQGLGLGLNFVKAVVEAHGGSVTVESVLHEGSCFIVRLPMAPQRRPEKES